MERSTFPTLNTIGKVNLLEFIERLDALVVFTLLMTVFFKASVLVYGTMIGLVDLFKLESHKPIILPIGIVVIFLSMTIASSFSEHIEEGLDIVLKYLSIPLLIILPLVLFLISMIRNILKRKAN
jgi:spore germination protein KB